MNPKAYFELVKPRVTFAALSTTFLGFWIAGGKADQWIVIGFSLLGALLVGSGCNAFNQFLERDIDRKMKRTEARPLPSGRLREADVLAFGLIAASLGVLTLYVFVHSLAGFLGMMTFLSYVVFYTPLKRVTPLNTFVGAFPGAMPALIGWSAATNHLGLESGVLFLILYLWQMPHFFAIAWMYREDYSRSGLRMMTIHDPIGTGTAVQILFYTSLFVASTLIPYFMKMAGWIYGIAAMASGVALMGFGAVLIISKMRFARQFMLTCLYDLFFLIIVMGLDRQ